MSSTVRAVGGGGGIQLNHMTIVTCMPYGKIDGRNILEALLFIATHSIHVACYSFVCYNIKRVYFQLRTGP